MKWDIKLKNASDPEVKFVLKYCKDFLEQYDTKKLDVVRIANTTGRSETIFGHTTHPNKTKGTGFKVVCYVHENIKFPLKVHQRRSPIYLKKNGVETEGALDEYNALGRTGDWSLSPLDHPFMSYDGKNVWVRVYEWIKLNSYDECIASIFAHEIGHFLSKTKQIKVHNNEIDIDKYQEDFVENYRKYKDEHKF